MNNLLKGLFIFILIFGPLSCSKTENSEKNGVTLKGGESAGGGGGPIRTNKDEIRGYIEFVFDKMQESRENNFYFFFHPFRANLPHYTNTPTGKDCMDGCSILEIVQNNDPSALNYMEVSQRLLGFDNLMYFPRGNSKSRVKLNQRIYWDEIIKTTPDIHLQLKNQVDLSWEKCPFLDEKHKLASYSNSDGKHKFCFDLNQLITLDPSTIEIQVLALIGHEILHMLHYDEEEAVAFQAYLRIYYLLAQKTYSPYQTITHTRHVLENEIGPIVSECSTYSEIERGRQLLKFLSSLTWHRFVTIEEIEERVSGVEGPLLKVRDLSKSQLNKLRDLEINRVAPLNEKKRLSNTCYPSTKESQDLLETTLKAASDLQNEIQNSLIEN